MSISKNFQKLRKFQIYFFLVSIFKSFENFRFIFFSVIFQKFPKVLKSLDLFIFIFYLVSISKTFKNFRFIFLVSFSKNFQRFQKVLIYLFLVSISKNFQSCEKSGFNFLVSFPKISKVSKILVIRG